MDLFQQQDANSSEKIEKKAEEVSDSVPMSGGDPIAALAAGSVLFAWYKFYAKGDKQGGIFVGLWAPTMFAAAGYLQQKDLVRKVRQGLSSF
ncbi:hypothetical protein [Halobaculum rarum]|uniref:hypothetical protein n=1 Tax=Halobaculum rarum TaxID=3075122 RepID=UPI0032AEF409